MSADPVSSNHRALAPDVDEIERRFRSPVVVVARPLILSGLGALGVVRRFGWQAQGADALAAYEQPLIFAANHCSHADTAAVLGTLPGSLRRRTCVAAALDVFGSNSNGHTHTPNSLRRECLQIIVAAGFHAFAFDRQGPPLRSLRTAVNLVRRGWNLLLYPEGTRSRDGSLGHFKAGVGVVARMTGRPVVPVHVSGGTTILPCGTFMPRRGRSIVRFGEATTMRRGESAAELADRVRQRVHELGRYGTGVAASPAPAPPASAAGRAAAR